MTSIIIDEAEADLEQAFDYYEARKIGLGRELLNEFRDGIDSIIDHPDGWQKLCETYCRYRLHRFPYGLFTVLSHRPTRSLLLR